jgi:hypothetical protein
VSVCIDNSIIFQGYGQQCGQAEGGSVVREKSEKYWFSEWKQDFNPVKRSGLDEYADFMLLSMPVSR